jgi:hypothetical protein
MKLTKNNKIILGLALGFGSAYALYKYNQQAVGAVASKTVTSNGQIDSAENPTTREGKVEYILANVEADAQEETSGFNGDRFQYNPMLGYALPVGEVQTERAGDLMTIGREGNLAPTTYFSADGSESGDPTVEADSIIAGMTTEEINVAYKIVKAKKNNPNLRYSEIMAKLGFGDGAKALFKGDIFPRLQDIKALKRSTTWKAKWEKRKDRLAKRIAKIEDRLDSSSLAKPLGGRGKGKRRDNNFSDQVTNRTDGVMWGGHRGDGKSTNAADYVR